MRFEPTSESFLLSQMFCVVCAVSTCRRIVQAFFGGAVLDTGRAYLGVLLFSVIASHYLEYAFKGPLFAICISFLPALP